MAISSVNMPTNGINNQQQQRYLNHPTSTSTLLFSSTPPNNGDLNNFNRPKVLMTNGQSPSAAQNTNFISNSCNLQAADPNKFKHVSKSATKSQKVSVQINIIYEHLFYLILSLYKYIIVQQFFLFFFRNKSNFFCLFLSIFVVVV